MTRALDPNPAAETASFSGAGTTAPPDVEAAPGGTIGRFVVVGTLGRGGMGVVLSAYDPVLDRKVALKLLRPGAWTGPRATEGRARLMREAQAMAKLAHPNVVAVHEIVTVGEQLFIAMEHIDGRTLRAWLAAEKPGWRAIVELFVAAGRGLQAAHAAGLVHRDFKPENVIVGSDGRPRVGDFGLVSLSRGDGDGCDEPAVTRSGAVLGTPGYMSPEQLRGEPSDAQSDQFSFCVALWEALHGQRPFPEEKYRQAVLAGRVTPPERKSGAPRAIVDAVARGLAVDRAARWPSMAELLDALAHDPAARRRRLVAVGALVVTLGAFGFAAKVMRDQRRARCSGASARLAGVWDAQRRQQAERAFNATRLSYAADTFAKVAAALDRYAGAWAAMHEDACRATRVEGRQSESLLDLRMVCLDRRRATLRALTSEWAAGVDGQALENAITAAAALPPVDECADARALGDKVPPPRDAVTRARIEAARQQLERARALGAAHRLNEARAAAESARRDADATGFVAVRAEAAFVLGSVIHRFGEPGAVAPLQDAARLAEQARDDRLAADAVIELVGAMADGGLAPAAILLSPVGEALVVRAGDRPEQRGALLTARGTAMINADEKPRAATVATLAEARTLLTRALGPRDPLTVEVMLQQLRALEQSGAGTTQEFDAIARELLATAAEVWGLQHPRYAVILGRVGFHVCRAGDYASAMPMLERSRAIAEQTFGPMSLQAAVAINLLGVCEDQRGQLDAAGQHYRTVLEIRRKLLAPDNPLVAHALANLSGITRLRGRLDEAREQVETALGIMRRAYGPMHSDVAFETGLLAHVLEDQHDLAGAREAFQRQVDTYRALEGSEFGGATLYATVELADFEARHGNCGQAQRLLVPAIAELEKRAGADGLWMARPLVLLGRCDVEAGMPARALPRLERAMAVYARPGMALSDRGSARFELARALAASGDATRARAQAQQAESELVQAGPPSALDLSRLRKWRRR
jgi:tetratricopeptide (TPR) repeat protein